MDTYPDILGFTDDEVCEAIERETASLMGFWRYNSSGWAPAEAAQILTRSMLDWQASLASVLKKWLGSESDGELILAWVNLGSLVEGLLKLFLCVYYKDYAKDDAALREKKTGKLKDPDGQELETLRVFFKKKVWTDEEVSDWDEWILKIQQRRNTVHAYKKREIGSFDEWRADLRTHLTIIRTLDSRLPYPDGDYHV
jgi:hypothetical protein